MSFPEEVIAKFTDPNADDFNHDSLRHWWGWKKIKKRILKRDNYTCCICHRNFGGSKKDKEKITVDHVVPVSKDKTKWYDEENLRAMCWDCHQDINREQALYANSFARKAREVRT